MTLSSDGMYIKMKENMKKITFDFSILFPTSDSTLHLYLSVLNVSQRPWIDSVSQSSHVVFYPKSSKSTDGLLPTFAPHTLRFHNNVITCMHSDVGDKNAMKSSETDELLHTLYEYHLIYLLSRGAKPLPTCSQPCRVWLRGSRCTRA